MDNYNLDDKWLNGLKDCQNEIIASACNGYYGKAYKDSEMYYWYNIPKWIYEDNMKREVTNCLDIGCAYGTLALYCKKLLNCNVYCTDFKDSYLSKSLINNYSFEFLQNNIELDPFPWDQKFDMIIFTEVLEHLNFHPLPTLKKIYNLLNDDGYLYLSTPDAASWGRLLKYYSNLNDMPNPNANIPIIDDHIYLFNKDELDDILVKSGFKIKRFAYSPGYIGKKHFNYTLEK